MKYAVVTRSDKSIESMSNITHPFLKEYAEKFDCDFIVLDQEPPFWTDDNRPHYRILSCVDLLVSYDRLILFDTDMIVHPSAPNLFETVPYECIGSIFEDKGTRANQRRQWIKNVQSQWGDVGWSEGYTNAGTFVISKCHSNIFDANNGEYWQGNGSVDIHLSYMARKYGHKIRELPYQWNHMTMFSEPWNNNADRFKSYVIHYAGRGVFDNNVGGRMNQIKKDAKWIRESMK